MKLYNILFSLRRFLIEQTSVRVDVVYDGYEYPSDKPFFTIQSLFDERIIRAKRREAVQSIEHIQLSYHAEYFPDMVNMADEVADLLTFNKIEYVDANKPDDVLGFFDAEVTAVEPMPAENINRESEKHRVHFDLEIENIKRGKR